jgi:solute:Na+ symporter, SSS family
VSATLAVTLIGIVVIAVFGFLGRRAPVASLSDWVVGGRKFGAVTMWFLQAGEVFTTFTFLGMAGLAFTGGVASFYALPYIPLAYLGLYFLGPLIWRRGRERGHLTQSDFLADFYDSRLLGTVTAVFGVIFLLPYLQLQITGLGLAVQLATGDKTSSHISMVIAFALVVAFVLFAGIHGVATTSYFKDALMIIVLIVLVIVIPLHFTGGIGGTFDRLMAVRPEMLRVHPGSYDSAWFFTSMLSSTLGVLFMTLPHQWPALLSAGSAKALRRNYMYLPIYSVALALPMVIGFTALVVLSPKTNSNGVLLTLTNQAFPPWFVGVVVVATAATAMVPAAGLIVGMSSVIARNIARVRDERTRFRVNQVAVVVVTVLALVLGLARPDLLANLLLLTYSGLDQFVPAIGLALLTRRLVDAGWVLAGLLLGEIVVIWLTFAPLPAFGHVNVGLIGLVPNLVVVAIGIAVRQSRHTVAASATANPTP